MNGLSDHVWSRRGDDTISERDFYSLYMLWTLAGLAFTALCANYTMPWLEVVPGVGDAESTLIWHGPINMWVLLLGTFVLAIIGVSLSISSNWVVSLIGYALVAGPFGAMLGPVVAQYTEASVVKVALVTAGVTVTLGLGGFVYPKSLASWGPLLFLALLGLVIGQFAVLIAAAVFGAQVGGLLTFLDWAGVLIFSGYIIYDVNRAKYVPRTLDNSVDCALALYLDIINLFIRLLAIMGQKK